MILFLLPILVGGVVMEIMIRHIPNDYDQKKNYLDKNSNDIQILILGSSHSFRDIDPAYFYMNAYNAAYVSQSLDLDLEILKKYKNEFKNLDVLILPISYFSFYSTLGGGKESWREKNYEIYYDIDVSNSLTDHFEILSNKLIINLKRLGSYYLLGNQPINSTKLGWGERHSNSKKNLIKSGQEAAKRHGKKGTNILDKNIKILRSIIELCEEQNVNVILYTPPAFKTYRQNIDKDQLQETVEKAKGIASTYSNCQYFNFIDDPRFAKEDFFDADHLNNKGAKKFTLILQEKINE